MITEIKDIPEPLRKKSFLRNGKIVRYSLRDFPAYKYVPLGRHPHPTMDPGGHMEKIENSRLPLRRCRRCNLRGRFFFF